MRTLPTVLVLVAGLVLVEVAFNALVRPQQGPPALAAAFETQLLAIGAIAAAVALLASLGARGPAASRMRVVAIAMLVVAAVRLGGEWWSPGTAAAEAGAGAADDAVELRVLTWNLEVGSKAVEVTLDGLLDPRRDPDLVALQELTPDVAAAIEADPEVVDRYPYRILEPADGVDGMGLLSRLPLVVAGSSRDPLLQRAGLLLPDERTVGILHAHPYPPTVSTLLGWIPVGLDTRRRDEELSVIAATVDRAEDRALVLLVGDLNATPFEGGFGKVSAGLLDAHAEAATGTGFTWRPSSLESLDLGVLRIDHVLSGSALRPLSASQDCSLPGDHCRLYVTLRVGDASAEE
jgi:endonuclease/exonuclease/phosphatase (EEP) superfamily protein YafD